MYPKYMLLASTMILVGSSLQATTTKINSTNTTGKTLNFAYSQFDPESGCFVLGNSTASQGAFALALAKKTFSTLTHTTTIDLLDLSPQTCSLNALVITDPATPAHVESTLYNKQVTDLAIMHGRPAIIVNDDPSHIYLTDYSVTHTIDTHYIYSDYYDYATAWTFTTYIDYQYVYDFDLETTVTIESEVWTSTFDESLATLMTSTVVTYSDRLIYAAALLKNATVDSGNLVDNAKLTDLDGNDPAYIRYIEASSHQIFAALAPHGSDIGQSQSCIRAAQVNETNDGLDLVAVSKSISNHAGSFGIQELVGDANIDDIGEIYWDYDLGRLFVGLDLTTNSNHKQGMIIGRVEGGDIIFEGAIPISLLDTTAGDTTSVIVGDGNHVECDPFRVYMRQIRTMRTSTNKTYLIAQVDLAPLDHENRSRKVYAMPVVINNDDPAKIGTLSVNHTATGPVTSNYYETFCTAISEVDPTDTPTSYLFTGNASGYEKAPALVGNGRVEVSESDQITDIYVLDDTIILSLKDDNPDHVSPDTVMERGQMGLVASTALFDGTGAIAGWTPWEPLNMLYDSIHAIGVDTASQGFWAIHGASADQVTFKPWGPFVGGMLDETLPILDEYLSSPDGRVCAIRVFPKGTLGLGGHRWTAACGYRLVLLAKSSGGDPFGATNDFAAFDENGSPALMTLGPVYHIEMSLTTTGTTGWFFAGGYGGLAVLAGSEGDGWDADTGLTSITDLPETASFHHLPEITETVYKIHSDGENIYALTRYHLFRFAMNGSKFTDPAVITPASLDAASIYSAEPGEFLLDIGPLERQGRGFLATTSKLCWLDDWSNTTTPSRDDWTTIPFSGTPHNLVWKAPTTDLNVSGAPKDEPGIIGNLYVTFEDYQNAATKIYRFATSGTLTDTVMHITDVNPINYDAVTDGLFKTIVHSMGDSGIPNRLWPYLDYRTMLLENVRTMPWQ